MTLNTPKKATIGVSALYRRATFKENIAYRHNFIDNQMLSVRKKLTTYATVLSVNAIRVSRAITDILMSTMMNCSTLIAAIVVNNSKNDTAVLILLAMATAIGSAEYLMIGRTGIFRSDAGILPSLYKRIMVPPL
eukprot:scaffold126090_cov46-Cyclotella_meneghiniana.AAC.1